MVWYFIGVYKINRTLHGRLEIRNFSSRVEKIFQSFAALTREIIFSTLEEKFCISTWPCNTLYIMAYNNPCTKTTKKQLRFFCDFNLSIVNMDLKKPSKTTGTFY